MPCQKCGFLSVAARLPPSVAARSSTLSGLYLMKSYCLFPSACSNTVFTGKSDRVLRHPHFHGSDGRESTCDAGDPGLIPQFERSPGEGNGYPVRYSCLENPTD